MAALTIRQLNDRTHAKLRERAAAKGRSVEAEVRAILDAAVGVGDGNVLLELRSAFQDVGGVDLPLAARNDFGRDLNFA